MIVIVPSRGRPHNIAALVECWRTTRACASLRVCVDDDDPELEAYRALDLGWFGSLIVGPRQRLGGWLNLAAQFAAAGNSDIAIGFMGDDHRPRTFSWDQTIEANVIVGGHLVTYGNDMIQGERLPTAVFLHSVVVRTLGYFVPPGMVHLYLDDFWKLLGERLGTLRYLPEVVIEHCHPTAGTAPDDERYAEVNAPEVYAGDKARFDEYVATRLDADIAKLQGLR
jgi:hypothetical protein